MMTVMRAPNEVRRLTRTVTRNEYAVSARRLYLLTKTAENINVNVGASAGTRKSCLLKANKEK
jgi:hypothetical protein